MGSINPYEIPPLTSNSSFNSLVPSVADVEISHIEQHVYSNSSAFSNHSSSSGEELNNAKKRADIEKTSRILGMYVFK